MSGPRMYSLSTVGVLKHYVHDYLFHPLRTDFIGPNGVGKSVIADLLQLLFVYDTDLIKFGTDAVKNEKRSIYTLPYGVGLAYCFLNVEVKPGQFLTIGIVLSAQSGTRIMPFALMKQPEMHLPLADLALTRSQIPWANDLLTPTRAIADVKALAAAFKERGIYLKTFRNKDDVRQYYQFLFDKEVLSINLSVDSNLKAFARVIQSFSKAKSLNLSPSAASRSLKEFLFEDEDKQLVADYEQQQFLLEKILREYSRLNTYIKLLEEKQRNLLDLRDLEKIYLAAEKVFLVAGLSELNAEIKEIASQEQIGKQDLADLESLQDDYDEKLEKLPRVEALLAEAVKHASDLFDLHTRYKQLSEDIEKYNDDINDLETLNPIKPDVDWEQQLGAMDMKTRRTEDIKDLVHFATNLLGKYPTLDAIESAWRAQEQALSDFAARLNQQKKFNDKLVGLLAKGSKESLIHWLAAQSVTLTNAQKSAILYFAATPVTQPDAAAEGDRYLDPNALLAEFEIQADSEAKGFWLKLGAVSELISTDAAAANLTFSAEDMAEEKAAENKLIDLKLAEIEKFKRGVVIHDTSLELALDADLREYSTITKLKEAVGCILYLDQKIDLQKTARRRLELEQEELVGKVLVADELVEPAEFTRRLRVRREQQLARKELIAKFAGTLDGLNKSNLKEIGAYKSQLFRLAENALAKNAAFEKKHSDYFKRYEKNLTEYSDIPLVKSLSFLEQDFNDSFGDYTVNYRGIAELFEETRGGANLAVATEISGKRLSFRVLEENLLGSKIKTTDDIAEALRAANSERMVMADEMKSNMVKVFERTLRQYKRYKDVIYEINTFFKGRKISDRFFFRIDFKEDKPVNIGLLEDIGPRIRNAAQQGQIQFEQPINEFIEEFFRRAAKLSERVPIANLLNPKTYFGLEIKLTDENDVEIPGSTGETYSAIALLGIARLSFVQAEKRNGLRFIILEEIGSLDDSNFSTFPAIAKAYGYQIITMSPHPFRTTLADDWYAHHLIRGRRDKNINFWPSASYFKTKDSNEDLGIYLDRKTHELD